MKNTCSFHRTAVVLALLFLGRAFCPGAAINLDLQTTTPKLEGLTAAASGGIPDISLQFQYDAKGKILIQEGSLVGTNPVSGKAVLSRKAGGVNAYSITAKGTTTKSLTLSLRGQLDSGVAACSYKAGKEKSSAADLPVSISFEPYVTAHFTLMPQVNSKGKITGAGTIVSGYGNETTNVAVLKGQVSKSKLSWQLKQGGQQLSYAGIAGSSGYSGVLTVKLPPDRGAYKPFIFPALPGVSGGSGTATFRGKVSASSQGSLPSPASGVAVTVRSDVDGNGTIESTEQAATATDGDGNYLLTCTVLDGGRAAIEFSLDGYAKQHKVVDPVHSGATVLNNATLKELVTLKMSGKTATSADGKLELQGLPSTVASVQGRAFNPVSEADQFPGEFADNQNNLLVSSTFATIVAQDSSGNPVKQLAGGSSSVRIQIPRDTWGTLRDLRTGNSQIDVPLYYYDEAPGKWVRSSKDGWLEDAGGAKIPENQLAALRNGSYSGSAYAVGPIAHLSYWNCDWPVDTHTCITGVVVDTNGNPVAGASVTVKGVTYNGTTSPKVTGSDGSFCAEVMRSEEPGEDINKNGSTGDTEQISIIVADGASYYSFGPYPTPKTQATCDQGNCLDLGLLRFSDANQLTVTLCNITGKFVRAGTGEPVSGAFVFGYDDAIDWLMYYMTNSTVSWSLQTDATGGFSLRIPVLTGATLGAYKAGLLDNATHTSEWVGGTLTTSGCPGGPVTIEGDWWRSYDLLDSSQAEIGFLYQFQSDVYCWFQVGTAYYWSEPVSGTQARIPAPGGSLTMNLLKVSTTSTDLSAGTITFTATSSIGGTWQATGGLGGTWGN
jgi:hypothetical protein